jgi:hypothetical protein
MRTAGNPVQYLQPLAVRAESQRDPLWSDVRSRQAGGFFAIGNPADANVAFPVTKAEVVEKLVERDPVTVRHRLNDVMHQHTLGANVGRGQTGDRLAAELHHFVVRDSPSASNARSLGQRLEALESLSSPSTKAQGPRLVDKRQEQLVIGIPLALLGSFRLYHEIGLRTRCLDHAPGDRGHATDQN